MDQSTVICSTCEHGVFDEIWGEYKCKRQEIYIYDAYTKTECELYEKEKKK